MGEIAAEAVPGLRVKFFFKQWGGVRKHLTGRTLDGRIYNEFPDRTEECVPENSLRMNLISAIQKTSGGFIPVTALAVD